MSIKVLGHRVHPMLIGFPIGLLGGSVAFDVAYLVTDAARWADVAFCLIAAGIVSGLVAAPFGSLDWLGVPGGTCAKRVGLWHGGAAFTSVALFALSWWMRHETPTSPETSAIGVSFVGAAILMVAGWLGGDLVERMGIGVDNGAHPNSPSSLSNRDASEDAIQATD